MMKNCIPVICAIALLICDKSADALALRRTNRHNVFEGYTCSGHSSCQGGGHCIPTGYESQYLCNCTPDRLGPYCELSVSKMKIFLNTRPMINYSFESCLNTTSKQAGTDVYRIYQQCRGGDIVCWLSQGGSNAVKAFFWCLNTGYNALMVEGRPSNRARLDQYSEIFQKLGRREFLQELPSSVESVVNPRELSAQFHSGGIDSVPVFGSRGPIPSVPDAPLSPQVSENRENDERIFEGRNPRRFTVREFPTSNPEAEERSREQPEETETEENLALIGKPNNNNDGRALSPFLQRLGLVNNSRESLAQYLKRKIDESEGRVLTQQEVFAERIAVLTQAQPSKKSLVRYVPLTGPYGSLDQQIDDDDVSFTPFSFDYNLADVFANSVDLDDILSSP